MIPKENHNAGDSLEILDVHCFCGKILMSLEKIFIFKYSETIFHLIST